MRDNPCLRSLAAIEMLASTNRLTFHFPEVQKQIQSIVVLVSGVIPTLLEPVKRS
jgi:hypothetical protein